MKMFLKNRSFSERFGLLAGAVGLISLIVFSIYGIVYDYFDTIVFLTLTLGIALNLAYSFLNVAIAELFNLLAAVSVSFGVGLFFLNSYPVWADRLNNITMYNSRGTLVPVVIIMMLSFVTVGIDVVSCFTRKENSTQ